MSQKNHLDYLELDVDALDINRTQAAQLKRLISCIKPNLSKMQRNLEKVEKYRAQMEVKNKELMEENEAYCAIIDSIAGNAPVAVPQTTPEPVQEQAAPVVEEAEEAEEVPGEAPETPNVTVEATEDSIEITSSDDFFGGVQTDVTDNNDSISNPFLS